MEWTFVLKNKGTREAGWWLKISDVDQLVAYYQETNPTRTSRAFENFMHGKEYDCFKPTPSNNKNHGPWMNESDLTYAYAMYAGQRGLTFIQGMEGFTREVALTQLRKIEEYGAIFINRVGGYHADYDGHHNYPDFVRRKQLVFPDFKKTNIRIRQFPGGEHYYAYIGDTQVRDGDTLKWSTYDEAYRQALAYIDD